MSSLQEIKGKVDQVSPDVLTEGDVENVRISKLGQIFTAGWKQRLALAGRVFTLDLGIIGGESTYTALTGNAAFDNDQPEFIIAIDSGWLIPLEIDIGISVNDDNAYGDFTEILVIADRVITQAAGLASSTIEVANNCLAGGDSFNGRCYSILGADIPNPTSSDILAFKYWEVTQTGAEVGGGVEATKGLYKKFDYPILLAGPCSIIGFVVGTNTPTFMGSVTFAHLPASWVTTS